MTAISGAANLTGTGVTTYNNEALWVERAGQLTLLAREGAPAPGMRAERSYGSGVLAEFGDIVWNALGQASFTARVGGSGVHLRDVSDHTGELGPVALPGSPAPGTDDEFGLVGYQMLSDAGRLAFRATLGRMSQWPPLGVWWDQPGEVGEIMALVVPGMPLPSDPSITIVSVNWLQGFNAAGQLAMRVVLQDPQAVQHEAMMIASPEGDLGVIVVAGETWTFTGTAAIFARFPAFTSVGSTMRVSS